MIAALLLSLASAPALAGPVPSGELPVVVRAELDRLDPDRLVIRGSNFGAKVAPIVLMSNVPLEVLSFSDEQIVARWPLDAPAATYRLQVLPYGAPPSPLFEVTLGGRLSLHWEGWSPPDPGPPLRA